MIGFVLCILTGVVAVQQLPELDFSRRDLLIATALTLFFALVRRWHIFFFLVGLGWAVIFAEYRLNDRLPETLAGQDRRVCGIVDGLPERDSRGIRFNLSVQDPQEGIPNKIRLTWYEPDRLVKAGQVWRFTVRLKPPHGSLNPGGFDYERWLFVQGIGATGYIRNKPEPELVTDRTGFFNLSAWRQAIADRLALIPMADNHRAIIKALTIGDGESLSPQQWEVFRRTGTTHLMVISGSHIGMIAALVYLLTGSCWSRLGMLRYSPQQAAALSAMTIAFLYAGLTGFSVPAQRAALMIAIAMAAIISQRHTYAFHVLALALLGVLLVDPLVVLLPGFWLSFSAVGLILYTLGGRLRKPGLVRSAIKINAITALGLSPLLVFFFQQVSLISPIANLIAVPVVGLLIVPLALTATLLLFVLPQVAEHLFAGLEIIIDGFLFVLEKFADLPLSVIDHHPPDGWAFIAAVPGILLLTAPKGMPGRWLGTVMLLPLVFTKAEYISPGTVKLTLLDVGQGLSAVVQTTHHVLIFDTGAKFSAAGDSGQTVVLPFLRSRGIRHVNTLMVSHGDNDHIGGAEAILEYMAIDRVLTSVPQQLSRYRPLRCRSGQSWVWDEVAFYVLSPAPGSIGSDNNHSCVLQIKAQHGSALLPGDIEAQTESWLLETYGSRLKSDVLIAPHHGSHSSSTSGFLNAVNPNVILIPAGYRNSFGHPHQDVLQRYRDLPAEYFNNAQNGAVVLDLAEHLTVQSWRESHGKYWNHWP